MKSFAESWFVKYKVYHLLFWMVYHYAWSFINHGIILELGVIFTSPKFAFYVIFQATAVYFNLYFLLPRFLEKGKYLQYISLLTLTIIVTSSVIAISYYIQAWMLDTTTMTLYGDQSFLYFIAKFSLPSTLTAMFLAMSIKLTKNWLQSRQREQLLEKEKLENELKFLRSQLNPHFLFNSINSIFVLIHKNPDMASEALAKFSDLLRYQLYECNEMEIPLEQELRFLQNYIELEKLRLDSRAIKLEVNIEDPPRQECSIAPLLLVPFVENAFKHASGWIWINLHFEGDHLLFSIKNGSSSDSKSRQVLNSNGIGLKNVERRLNLIYPKEHELTIDNDKGEFSVLLKISRC